MSQSFGVASSPARHGSVSVTLAGKYFWSLRLRSGGGGKFLMMFVVVLLFFSFFPRASAFRTVLYHLLWRSEKQKHYSRFGRESFQLSLSAGFSLASRSIFWEKRSCRVAAFLISPRVTESAALQAKQRRSRRDGTGQPGSAHK